MKCTLFESFPSYIPFQAAEVEQRLKSLQGDYSALQNAHDQLERDGAARESELKCQIARLVEGEEQRGEEEKVGRMEMEKTVVELQKRITELEAMREAATWLNEKNGVNDCTYSILLMTFNPHLVHVLLLMSNCYYNRRMRRYR